MKKVFLISALLLTSFYTWAAPINGVISFKENKVCLFFSQTNKTYIIEAQTPEVESHLKKLKAGDMVNGQGRMDLLQNKVSLNSINYVGLKKLIGHWVSQDQFNYFFKDYENLSVSAPILSQANYWTYRVSPGDHDDWSIIFLNQDSAKVGKMMFHPKKNFKKGELQILLFDPNSGGVIQNITLSRKY